MLFLNWAEQLALTMINATNVENALMSVQLELSKFHNYFLQFKKNQNFAVALFLKKFISFQIKLLNNLILKGFYFDY